MTDSPATDKRSWVRRLVQQHQSSLIRYAQSIVRDEHLARDLVQETFLRLCQQPPDYFFGERSGSEAAWLFRVCHNLAINRNRKDRRMTTGNPMIESAATNRDPTDEVVAAEDSDQVARLIDELPDNQQKVIRLKFYGGLKYREISESTGLSESNVGFLLHTGISTLRQRLKLMGAT